MPVIFSSNFNKYLDVILLLILAMSLSFTARVLGTACTSLHKNKEQLFIACLCIGILSVTSYFSIPTYQLKGAAYSMILAYGSKNFLLIIVLVSWMIRNRNKGNLIR